MLSQSNWSQGQQFTGFNPKSGSQVHGWTIQRNGQYENGIPRKADQSEGHSVGRRLEVIEVIAVVVAVIVLAALPCIRFIAERNWQRDEQAEKTWYEDICIPYDGKPSFEEYKASQMPTDDPIAAECMARALNSGKIVFANVGEDGQVKFSEG